MHCVKCGAECALRESEARAAAAQQGAESFDVICGPCGVDELAAQNPLLGGVAKWLLAQMMPQGPARASMKMEAASHMKEVARQITKDGRDLN